MNFRFGSFILAGVLFGNAAASTAAVLDWQRVSSGTSSDLTDVHYGAGVWVAAGDGTILSSTNARDWTSTLFPEGQSNVDSQINLKLHSYVHFAEGNWVIEGSYSHWVSPWWIFHSTDGFTWTTLEFNSTNFSGGSDVAFANGTWIARGGAFASPDGAVWSERKPSHSGALLPGVHSILRVFGSDDLFIGLAYQSLFTSSDGLRWTANSNIGFSQFYGINIYHKNGVWAVCGRLDNGGNFRGPSKYLLATSSDLVSWTFVDNPSLFEAHLGDDYWLALGSTDSGTRVYRSSDRLTWADGPVLEGAVKLHFANNTWVAVGSKGGIYVADATPKEIPGESKKLRAKRDLQGVRFEWPIELGGQVLLKAPHLDGPWEPLDRVAGDNGGTWSISVPVGSTQEFFAVQSWDLPFQWVGPIKTPLVISGDGSTIATERRRWRSSVGWEGEESDDFIATYSVTGISFDGSVILANRNRINRFGNVRDTYLWSSVIGELAGNDVYNVFPKPCREPGFACGTTALDLSDDGTALLWDNGKIAFKDGTLIEPPVPLFSFSGDASAGIARKYVPLGRNALGYMEYKVEYFYWNGGDSAIAIVAANSEDLLSVTSISGDGSTVVGTLAGPSGVRAFRWTEAEGITELEYESPPPHAGSWHVSADGSVVVGGPGPFIWDADHGMRRLSVEIEKQLGRKIPGRFNGTIVRGISADGTKIVGGYNPAWIATVPRE